jgi:hypothetical protein
MEHFPLAYNSGNIRAINETRASISIGAPLGITVNTQASIIEMAIDYAKDGGQVFCDSGAFSEFKKGTNLDVETGAGKKFWTQVLSIYNGIIDRAGDQACNIRVVAPDQVGNPDISEKNLEWLCYEVNKLMEKGARVIQPVQMSSLGAEGIAGSIANLSNWYMNFDQVILGFPSKAAAWHTKDILGWLTTMSKWEKATSKFLNEGDQVHPKLEIHLLGKGDPRELVKLQKAAQDIRPNTCLDGDSVPTGGVVGKGRKLTVAMTLWVNENPKATKEERGLQRGRELAKIELWKREQAEELFTQPTGEAT